ncbi:zinc transporter ZIP1-like [Amphiura filiformis]|uniref:zinc transporter ZIP1-like n=1 Tax=Amphiura filiformis TaxID=82378 RepID=UPI003B21CB4D
MEVTITKVLVLFSLLCTCLLAGLAPLRFARFATHQDTAHRRKRAIRAMSFLSCYGGGVFLATCLLDLLPTVRDKLSDVFDRLEIYTSFPVAEFVVAIGFFIIVIVEQVALDCKEASGDDSGHSHGHFHADENDESINDVESNSSRPLLEPPIDSLNRDEDNINADINIRAPATNRLGYGSFNRRRPRVHKDSVDEFREQSREEADLEDHDMHSHSSLRALMLLVALSLHSIFEGLAIGLQGTNDQVLDIFTAVIIHKTILAFSLGMSLVQSKLSKRAIIQACMCFAIMAPIGIAVGIAVDTGYSDFTHSVFNGLLQGIATGTFLYITFFEVLPHEMHSPSDRLLKVLCLILGFSTICGLLFLEPDVVRPACYRNAEPV